MHNDRKSLSQSKKILLSDKIFPKKSLGQNFILELEVLDRMCRIADLTGNDRVLEIGAGLGTLTNYLAERAKRVVAIEKDKRLFERLAASVHHLQNVDLVMGDVLKINLRELFTGNKMKVISNLPYSISSPILISLLENRDIFSLLVIMIQREVGERIIAGPGGRDYGSISVLLQIFFDISIEFIVHPEAFWPKPKVESVVLKLIPLPNPRIEISDMEFVEKIVRASFSSRRKILANSLRSLIPKENIEKILNSAGIDGKRRAETLSVQEFGKLAGEVFKIVRK